MRGEAQAGDSFPCHKRVAESGQSSGAFLPHFCSLVSVEGEGDLPPAPSALPPRAPDTPKFLL